MAEETHSAVSHPVWDRPAGIVSSFDLRIRHVSCREYGGSSYRHQELKESRPRQNFLAMVKIITLTVGLIVMRISRRKAQFDIGLTRHFYTLSSIKDLLNLRSYDVVQTRQNYILLTGWRTSTTGVIICW